MEKFQKSWALIASILGTVLLVFQFAEAFTGNRTLFTGLLILVSLLAIGAGMWNYAFAPSVIKDFPKYRFHWVAKFILALDLVSILISATYILTILEVVPDCCRFASTKTSTPTSVTYPVLTIDPCKSFISRVYRGEKVHTANILNKNLNIRKLPNISAPIITSVQNGTELQILSGPICADTLMWWEAETINGSAKGWIAEENSNGTYYFQP